MYQNYLQQWSPLWSGKFTDEAEKIKSALGENIKDIQHIGSTSIPGMSAKPIIDMGVLVDSIENTTFFVEKLEVLGYSYKPDMSSMERIFMRKGTPVEYHLSIACPRHTFWERQILFRNYLIKHPKLIQEYNNLKSSNIESTPKEDFEDLSRSKVYNKGKGDFVAKVLELAQNDKQSPV
ncbi:MAG: GrpB family protein [bacterium]|nr:GrpB family protein [bacterium]